MDPSIDPAVAIFVAMGIIITCWLSWIIAMNIRDNRAIRKKQAEIKELKAECSRLTATSPPRRPPPNKGRPELTLVQS